MKNLSFAQVATSFNTTIETIDNLEKTSPKNIIQAYQIGDVLACFAGFPSKELCIVELVKKADIDNIRESISGKSYIPLTSHLMSSNWFKIN